MQRIIAGLALSLALIIGMPMTVSADVLDAACEQAPQAPACQDRTPNNPLFGSDSIVENVANILAFVVGAAAVMVMIINGIKLIASQGEPQELTKSRNAIIHAAIGVIVVVLARSIIFFVLKRFD